MFEKRHQSLASRKIFLLRLLRNLGWGLLAIMCAQFLGMCGYHYLENMSWVDAFVNAAMILSGMGPVEILHTNSGKIFAGLYALFSGLAFILIVGLIFSPILHRFFHKFHLDTESSVKPKK